MIHDLLAGLSRWLTRRAVRRQRRSSLRDPRHWGGGIDENGHLEMDQVNLPDLVDRWGSPLLAVSRSSLQTDATAIVQAANSVLSDTLVAYSYKTNSVPGVLREIHACGLGAEVVSPYELWLAERLGVPGSRIIVNGVNKTRGYLEHAARLHVLSTNIDHRKELDLLLSLARNMNRRLRVGLRLRVDEGSHFGLCVASGEARRTAKDIAVHSDLLEFSGLQFHALAHNDDPARHVAPMIKALDFATWLDRELGLVTSTLDVGGGYGVPTTRLLSRSEYAAQRLVSVPGSPPVPSQRESLTAYLNHLTSSLTEYCALRGLSRPRLIIEPGRAVVSRSHVLLTRVHGTKPNLHGPCYVLTDAGRVSTASPCDYEYHQMFVANQMLRKPSALYHLMGRLCTSADWLARNRLLPEVVPGDVLAVMDAGAYFSSYFTNFSFPRPAVLMLDDRDVRLLRRRESYEHMVAMDTVESSSGPCRVPAVRFTTSR